METIMAAHDLNLPWRVVRNWRGKITIVDQRNVGSDTTTQGRVCNLPEGENGRGLFIALRICEAMNRYEDDTAPRRGADRRHQPNAGGGRASLLESSKVVIGAGKFRSSPAADKY